MSSNCFMLMLGILFLFALEASANGFYRIMRDGSLRFDNTSRYQPWLISDWLKQIGVEAVSNPVDSTNIFANYNEATADTPCALATSNFDLAEHAFSSSIDPLGNYFNYHSSQFEPDGANDAQVKDTGIDAALDTVKNSVDFAVIKDAMAEFQKIYVEKTVEVPLYYRKNVDLVSPKLGNFFANPTQAGPTWNAVDWFAKS